MSRGRLHLLPNLLSPDTAAKVIAPQVSETLLRLQHYIVENEKVSRRFLKTLDRSVDIDAISFEVLDKRSDSLDYRGLLAPAMNGVDIGLMSDAGCPAVADPGALVVAAAHELGIRVIPHVGPSSILMTVMASGMNGQAFAFNGYIPKDKGERIKTLKRLEESATKQGITQVFMDTPYRNQQLLDELIAVGRPSSRLCIAMDITGSEELIRTMSLADWKKKGVKLGKIPVMFALGR